MDSIQSIDDTALMSLVLAHYELVGPFIEASFAKHRLSSSTIPTGSTRAGSFM